MGARVWQRVDGTAAKRTARMGRVTTQISRLAVTTGMRQMRWGRHGIGARLGREKRGAIGSGQDGSSILVCVERGGGADGWGGGKLEVKQAAPPVA